jgi:hypothetical protein
MQQGLTTPCDSVNGHQSVQNRVLLGLRSCVVGFEAVQRDGVEVLASELMVVAAFRKQS